MQDDISLKENYEERLLSYIDIPYFRNNPTYIELWRRYYDHHRDPQILLLMYYKEISTHYHWIYIELAKHFVRLNRAEIAHFILSEALQNKVYDRERLVDTISRLPPFEKKYSRGDMACVLNQKNIKAIGKTWNKYEEVFFYERHLDASSANFEMMKLSEYLKTRNLGVDEGQRLFFTDGIRMEHDDDPVFVETIYFSKEKCLKVDFKDSGQYPEAMASQNAFPSPGPEHDTGASSLNKRDEHSLDQCLGGASEAGCEGMGNDPGKKEHGSAPENETNTYFSCEDISEETNVGAIFSDHKEGGLADERAEDGVSACYGAGRDTGVSRLEKARHLNVGMSLSRSDLVDENIKIDSLVSGEYDYPHVIAPKSADSRKTGSIGAESGPNLTLKSEDGSGFMGKKCRSTESDQSQHHASLETHAPLKHADADLKITVEDESRTTQQDAFRNHAEIHEILGDLEDNSELIINNFVHLVQESGDGFYLTMRIARDADITQTLAGRNFCLREITERNAAILDTVRKSEYCASKGRLFIMFEFDKLESLSKILTFCDPMTGLFYLKQVLTVINEFLQKSVTLCNLNFFVDQRFNAVLFDNAFECHGKADERKIIGSVRLLFGECDVDFNQCLAGIVAEVNHKTSTREFRLALLRHKAAVLNAL